MNGNDLNEALKRISGNPIPTPPANMSQNVWREIRLRRGSLPTREGFFESCVNALLRPRWALSAATMAIGISITFGLLENANASNAHASLDLNVFSATAPTLPSTLLAHSR
jgi:hypothetical protein